MLSHQATAIAVTNKETMQMELSSKVRDLCQVCNWARTVTALTRIYFLAGLFFSTEKIMETEHITCDYW